MYHDVSRYPLIQEFGDYFSCRISLMFLEKEGKVGVGEDVTALECAHLLPDKTAVQSSFAFSGVCFFQTSPRRSKASTQTSTGMWCIGSKCPLHRFEWLMMVSGREEDEFICGYQGRGADNRVGLPGARQQRQYARKSTHLVTGVYDNQVF